jgi:hypothetical protein
MAMAEADKAQQVYDILRQKAKRREVVFYSDIARQIG